MPLLKPNSIYTALGVKVNVRIIPTGIKSSKNVYENGAIIIRKGEKFKADLYMIGKKPQSVTVHNTDEISVNGTTMAEQYSRATYPNENMGSTRVHYYVDEAECWQNLRDDEQGWHCSASINPNANKTSIAIEIIGKSSKAEDNGARIAAYKLYEYGLPISKLKSHKDWTGKNCPAYILPHWVDFVKKVNRYLDELNGTTLEKSITDSFKVGDRVIITSGYAVSAYSSSATNKAAVGNVRYITKIYSGANYPYRLGTVKGSMEKTTGFANFNGIKKLKKS